MKLVRGLGLAGFALFALLPASADTGVPKGLWSYDASAALGPLPMRESGTHCVDDEMSETSYESLFNDINPNCSLASGTMTAEGYQFTLACNGGPTGELKGRLIVNDETASLNATGWTSAGKNSIPVILAASARKVSSSCAG